MKVVIAIDSFKGSMSSMEAGYLQIRHRNIPEPTAVWQKAQELWEGLALHS